MASSSVLCGMCRLQNRYIAGVMWCPDCDLELCTDCSLQHQSEKATESHKFLDVNYKVALSKQQECTVHSELRVEYYCPVHDVIFCHVCQADTHRECDGVITIDTACQNADKLLLGELLGEIENIDKTINHLEDETNKNSTYMKIESKNIETAIGQAKAKAVDRINEYEKKLLLELQLRQREAERQQQEIKQKCTSIAEKLVSHSKVIQYVQKHETPKKAFLLSHNLKPMVEKMDESVSALVKSSVKTSLKFDQTKYLIKSIPKLGSITKSEITSQVTHTPITEKYAQCILPKIEKPMASFKLTSSFRTSDTVNILGMIVAKDHKILMCNYTDKHEVLVYNGNGRYNSAITTKHQPFDITLLPGGDQYVVTLPLIRSIQYISNDLQSGRSVELYTVQNIFGIAADKKRIYVGARNKIVVLNYDGSVVREIQLDYSGLLYYLLVYDNNVYAISINDNVYCIDQNGRIRQSEISGEGTIRKIIVDRQGNIYVCRENPGNVLRLEKDLRPSMTIGDGSLSKIGAICFNNNCTKLFVAKDRGKTIAVFSCT